MPLNQMMSCISVLTILNNNVNHQMNVTRHELIAKLRNSVN